MTLVNLVLHLYSFVLMAIVFFGNFRIYKYEKLTNRWFIKLAFLNMIMLLSKSLFFLITLCEWDKPLLLGLLEFIFYASHFAFICTFVFFQAGFVRQGKAVHSVYRHISIVICSLSAFMLCTCAFNEYIYTFDPGHRILVWMYVLGQAGGVLILALSICMLIQYHKYMAGLEIKALLTFHILPVLSIILRCFIPDLRVTPVGFSFSMVIINIFAMYNRSILLGQREAQVNRDRMRLMLSQIQPHFIYNVLNTIYNLCDINVEMAKEAIDLFSGYLRKNFKSIEGEEFISIKDELEHVKFYFLLEKMRFKDELELITDVDDVDFMIPQLSVEPLVENAIKHGILKRQEGGTIFLSVKDKGENHVITIEDNGVGFDPAVLSLPDADHVGIRNIRERLEYMGAALDITSIPGEKTTCIIRVPK